jgi:class 3 adenylate cyclase
LLGVFGLPPESHEDDGVRAVLAALAISKELGDNCNIQSRIGVTTGNAFCGDVGNDVRREYAMVGDIVVWMDG